MVMPRNTSSATRRSGCAPRAWSVVACWVSATSTVSGSSATVDMAVSSLLLRGPAGLQVPQSGCFVASALVDAGDVVVGVGVYGIELDRAAIRFDRVGVATEVLEGDAEVEGSGLMIGVGVERGAVVFLRRCGSLLLVKEAAEVHVGIGVTGIQRDDSLVRFLCLIDIGELELAA